MGGRGLRMPALVLLMVMALAAGCTSPAAQPLASETPAGPAPAASTAAGRAAPSPSPSPSDPLDARYRRDSDGNAIPDAVEVEMGLDPEVDDCLQEPCPDADEWLLRPDPAALERNVMLILDASGSMAGPDGAGGVKMSAARDALERYVVGTPDTTNLGLMVYGHHGDNSDAGKAASCAGIDVLAGLGELDPGNAAKVLRRFEPTGWTPIADALAGAADAFAGRSGEDNRVVLVTDGVETCDGDPVAAARALSGSGIAVTVDVVGFDIADSAEEAALREIADVTGGSYATARDAAQLDAYIDELLDEQQALLESYQCLQRAWLQAGVCTARSSEEAVRRLRRERDASPLGSARYAALDELIVEIAQWSIAHNDTANQVTLPRLEELLSAYRTARQRYERRYGRELSWVAPPCPHTGRLA